MVLFSPDFKYEVDSFNLYIIDNYVKDYDREYNNNVHFEGVRFICGPHLAIIGPSEARADLMAM